MIEIGYVVLVFAGFPAALNAVSVARRVFAATKRSVRPPAPAATESDRRRRGLAAVNASSRQAGEHVLDALADIAPDLADFIVDFSYGDVLSRAVLTPAQKEIAMVAAATARGTMAPQLAVHLKTALQIGVSQAQLVEVLLQMVAYAGFPAALNGVAVLRTVLRDGAAGVPA